MELDELVTEQQYSETEKSSSSSSRSSRDYPEPSEKLVRYVLANLKAYDGSFHIPAFADDDDASELPDEILEKLELPDGTTNTLEGLFSVEVGGEYLGEAGDLEADSSDIDRHATIMVMKGINGYHSDIVEDVFPGASIGVGVGSSRKFDDDERRNKWVQFRVTDTEKSERTRWRAMLDVGELSEDEYVEKCLDADIHPWPRDQNAPDLETLKEEHSGDDGEEDREEE